ncbi:MAG: hypothetical protein CMH41_05950 [Micrococcales bacterium]|nr:hypothetical protein [Micrococcales bacterium]
MTQTPDPTGDEETTSEAPSAAKRDRSEDMSVAIAEGIGGTSGLLDSGLPTAVFLVVYLASGSQLMPAVWAAVAAGIVVAIIRRIRGESLRHIAAGLIGLAFAAWLAARTGRAQDFFLPGILINVAYGCVFAISALVRRPLVGYAAGAVSGDLTSWRGQKPAYRGALATTWVWAGLFGARVAVQLPLYLLGAVGALGAAKLIMGWPLFLFAGYISYRIMRPRMQPDETVESPESDQEPDQTSST